MSSKKGLPDQVKMRHSSHFVDELAARSEQPIGKIIQIEALEPDPKQPRVDFGNIEELAASIRSKGVLEPILVRPLARERGEAQRYRIISGERRYRAASSAGLPEVPVIEMDLDDDEALEVALIENLQRKDLDPFEEAEGLQALQDRFDYTHEQIAATMAKSRTVVTEALALLRIPDRLRKLARDNGMMTKSLLLEISKLESTGDMEAVLAAALSGGLTRDQVRDQVRGEPGTSEKRTGKRPTFRFSGPDESFRIALTFDRPAVERHDVIKALEEVLEGLRLAERDDEKKSQDPEMLF